VYFSRKYNLHSIYITIQRKKIPTGSKLKISGAILAQKPLFILQIAVTFHYNLDYICMHCLKIIQKLLFIILWYMKYPNLVEVFHPKCLILIIGLNITMTINYWLIFCHQALLFVYFLPID